MGCEKHPVEPEIQFLDGRAETFIRLPKNRWQKSKWHVLLAVVLAVVFAWVFAVIVERFR